MIRGIDGTLSREQGLSSQTQNGLEPSGRSRVDSRFFHKYGFQNVQTIWLKLAKACTINIKVIFSMEANDLIHLACLTDAIACYKVIYAGHKEYGPLFNERYTGKRLRKMRETGKQMNDARHKLSKKKRRTFHFNPNEQIFN